MQACLTLCIVWFSSNVALGRKVSYDIPWGEVDLEPAASKDLTASCTCNLHPFVCDRDCCCDSDCPQAVSDASRLAGACRPEGPAEQTLDFCVPDGFVARVRARLCL
jgi:hypothetical protein